MVTESMKNSVSILFLAISNLVPVVSYAVNSLNDRELDYVSGGGVNIPQQPQTNSQRTILPGHLQSDGKDVSPVIYTLLNSSSEVYRGRIIFLSGDTQQNSFAYNLQNSISSDLISLNNVFNGNALHLTGEATGVEVNQKNDLTQKYRKQGYLTAENEGYQYQKIIERQSGGESYEYLSYSSISRQHHEYLNTTEQHHNSAQVGLHLSSEDNRVTYDPPDNLVAIRSYGPFLAVGDCSDGVLCYTGTRFHTLGLDLNSIGLSDGILGSNITLYTTFTDPKIDFGHTYIDPLFADTIDINFGSIGGGTSYPELTIPVLGVYIDELNIGSGFSLSGSGSHNIVDPGGLSITGDLTLAMNAYATLVVDLSKTILKKSKSTLVNATFDSELTIPFVVLDEKYNNDSIEQPAGDSNSNTDTVSDRVDTVVVDNQFVDTGDSFVNKYFEKTVLHGVNISAAEAELLALSDGSLSINNTSNINMDKHAQQNMRVFNSVNAVSSVAANTMNISRLPSVINASSSLNKLSVQQHNNFVQQH